MLDGDNLNILVAFVAGIVTFASPCCLPLVPVYLAHMSDVTLESRGGTHRRLMPAMHASVFVLGFTIVFVAFWASLGVVGYALQDISGPLSIWNTLKVGDESLRLLCREDAARGRFLQRLLVAFQLRPTPHNDLLRGTVLLLVYSLGLGVPFIAAAFAVDAVTRPLKEARWLRVGMPVVSGVLVVGIGVLMLTNTLVQMPQYFDWGGSPRG